MRISKKVKILLIGSLTTSLAVIGTTAPQAATTSNTYGYPTSNQYGNFYRYQVTSMAIANDGSIWSGASYWADGIDYGQGMVTRFDPSSGTYTYKDSQVMQVGTQYYEYYANHLMGDAYNNMWGVGTDTCGCGPKPGVFIKLDSAGNPTFYSFAGQPMNTDNFQAMSVASDNSVWASQTVYGPSGRSMANSIAHLDPTTGVITEYSPPSPASGYGEINSIAPLPNGSMAMELQTYSTDFTTVNTNILIYDTSGNLTANYALPGINASAIGSGAMLSKTTTTSALSTTSPTTSIPVVSAHPMVTGDTINITSGINTQAFTVVNTVNAGDTSIPVLSDTANFAYPAGSQVSNFSTGIYIADQTNHAIIVMNANDGTTQSYPMPTNNNTTPSPTLVGMVSTDGNFWVYDGAQAGNVNAAPQLYSFDFRTETYIGEALPSGVTPTGVFAANGPTPLMGMAISTPPNSATPQRLNLTTFDPSLGVAGGVLGLSTTGGSSCTPGAAGSNVACATVDIGAGSLIRLNAPDVNYATVNLNGQAQITNANVAYQVRDATGSGSGWSMSLSATTFTDLSNTAHTLPNNALTLNAPSAQVCITPNCTVATDSVGGPIAVATAAASGPTVKILNATANTGMGSVETDTSTSLTIPASAYQGAYSSTWTLSLTSGP